MTTAGDTCYLDGEFIALAEARVPVLDRGFIFGDAVYEVLPALGGRIFALEEHLARLARSLAAVGITAPLDDSGWAALLATLIARNGGGDLSVYLQVTRGVAPRDHAFPAAIRPTVFVMCRPFAVTQGVVTINAVTVADNRWGRCDIKSTSLLANVLLRNEALRRGAYEAVLLRDGYVTEGAASNVFVVRDGVVRTPPLSEALLAGVTRHLLLDVLCRSGIACEQVPVSAAELREADEIWVTSSSRDLLCVAELDGETVGNGLAYPLACAALEAFAAYRDERLSAAQADTALQ